MEKQMRILILVLFCTLAIFIAGSRITNSAGGIASSPTSDSASTLSYDSSDKLRSGNWSNAAFASTTFLPLNPTPPVAVNDSYTVHGGDYLTPVANDTGQNNGIASFTQPAHGSTWQYSSYMLAYSVYAGYVGSDSFTYTICDTPQECSTATVSISVVNQPPVAQTDSYTVHGGLQVVPIQNDSDPDNDSISTHSIVTQPQHGTLTPYNASVFTYSAQSGYIGSDSFTYRICDYLAACSNGTVNLDVVNQAPVAQTDNYTVHGGIEVIPGSNDSDPEGDSLGAPTILTQPQHGTLTPYNAHVSTYGANSGFVGSDSFTYRICDALGACSTGTVHLNVVNQAPVAAFDFYRVEDGKQIIPTENDFDPDQDSLSNPIILTQPQHGTLTPWNSQVFDYAPSGGYTGSDSFTYRVCDYLGLCSNGTVMLVMVGDGEDDGVCESGYLGGPFAVGEPVNVTNGNMYLQQNDYHLPGIGHQIDVTRTYNSNSSRIGLFGRGWTTPYDESITAYDINLVRLNQPDGRAIYLARSASSSGALTPLEGDFHGSIVQNGSSGFTLTMKDGSVHEFNAAGKLLSLLDSSSNQTTLAYDVGGKLSSITDPFGRVLSLLTNLSGLVTSIADTTGVVADYTYGGSSELLSVTYADNSAFQFGYDGNLRLTAATDGLGNILEAHTYDLQGRALTSEKDGGVERYTINYVSASQTEVTDALGNKTKYIFDKSKGRNVVTSVEGLCSCGGSGSQVQSWTYDNQLNVTSMTDGLNHVTTYTYDTNGNRLTETNVTGTITFTSNSLGRVLTRTDQMGGVTTNTYSSQGNLLTTKDALNHTTTLTYDSHGQLLTVTDPRNNTTTLTYSGGNLTRRTDALNNQTDIVYDGRGRVTSTTDALNQTTSYEYDLAGRPKKIIYPDTNFVEFTYDLAGRKTKSKDPRGYQTNFAYDSTNRLTTVTNADNKVTSYSYDLMSNVTGVTDALNRTVNYSYDDFNRLTKIKYPEANSGAGRLEKNLTYDAAGRLMQQTDQASRSTSFAYDSANRMTSSTDPALKVTAYEYNARSERTAVVDALSQRYEFVYDALGRVVEEKKGSATRYFVYDTAGNRTQRTDYNGAVTNYTSDVLNRLTTISYPDSTSETYGYDALSQLTTATNTNGTDTIAYDNRSRVNSVTDVFGKVVSYSYDASSNRTQLSVGGASNASYQYDSVNRLTQLTDNSSLAFTFAYDASDKLTSRIAPNGTTATYQYDGLDRLTRLTHAQGTTTVADFQYQLDSVNNITQMTDSGGAHNYAYDVVDRLTSATHPAQSSKSYTYDGVGNRTTSQQGSTYSYQAFNRQVVANSSSYGYDANGNLTAKTNASGTWTYTWDYENRLKQAALSGGVTVDYSYDALGRRIQRNSSISGTTKFVYDGPNVVRDLDASGGTIAEYINGPGVDNKFRQTAGSTTSYFIQDHLGSTRALADTGGNVTSNLDYDSFGNVTSGSASTRYTYTGREADADIGFLYYRARWYDPQSGRFTSEDPIGLEGGINEFAYVGNNPVKFNDPSGLSPQNPPSARNATPDQQARFDAAYLDMIKRLRNPKCARAFGGLENALRGLRQTQFGFADLGHPTHVTKSWWSPPDSSAQTSGRAVTINSFGSFMSIGGNLRFPFMPQGLATGANVFPVAVSGATMEGAIQGDIAVSAFILLHELGHRTGKFKPDGVSGDPAASIRLQGRNNAKIWNACGFGCGH
jgi:RHS repeat-associated protein